MKNSNCIIITQKEWLNWLAFGYLRVSPSRISYFDNTESSFDILMSYSVDNALDEEDAYLLASLVDDYSREELHVKRTSLLDYILVQAVQGFYTLSAKGADLLEYEAGQSHSILHDDSKIEDLWNEWKNTQFKLRSHDKGNKFLEILGYQKFKSIPELKTNTLLHKELESYGHAPLPPIIQGYSKICAFTWFYTSAKFSQVIGKEKYSQYKMWREISKNEELRALNDIYNEQTSSKDMFKYLAIDNTPLVKNLSFIAEKIFFDSICKSEDNFLAISFLVHYYNLLDNNLEIDLYFLKTDLTFLDEIYSTKDISQLIAYFIGRRLNEVYLSFLYIAQKIDKKNLGVFDKEFFSDLKKERLILCNVDRVQLQNIANTVNSIAEEIQRIYNVEVNNIQESEIGSDTIEVKGNNLNQSIPSQASIIDNGNIKISDIHPNTKVGIFSNKTDNNPTPPHPDTQYSVDSKYSGDSTNRIDDSNQPIHSQPPITYNSNNENDRILPGKSIDTPSNTTNYDSIQPHSKARNSEESENNTKYIYKSNEIESDTKPSNLSTTTNNENETIKRDQIQEGEQMSFSMESTTEKRTPINPTELLRDAISTIKELPEDKKNHGGVFQNSLFSKNARYKDQFKNSKNLSDFFEAFAKIVGNDMKIHKSFGGFKKELLSNSNLPNK